MYKTFINSILLVAFVIILALVVYIGFRGILFYDEGWVLYPAQRILQGQIPYKDFHYIYTPGSIYITALAYRVFGESILSTRIMVLFFDLISILAIFYVSKIFKLSRTSALISMLLFLAWTPLHLNFSWPVIYVSAVYLLTLLCLGLYLRYKKLRHLVLAGIFSFFTLLFKQNFGAAVLTSMTACILLFSKTRIKDSLAFYLSFVGALGIWLLYLIFTGSFLPFLKDMDYIFIQGKGIQASPFIYPSSIMIEIIRTAFYLLPLILSSASIYIIRRKNLALSIIPIFVLIFYLFGIRPTTDFTHYVELIAISGLTIGIIYDYSNRGLVKIGVLSAGLLLVILGIYTAFFRGYYTWNPTISNYDQTIKDNRVGIYIDAKSKQDILKLQNVINTKIKKDDYIFATSFSPLFYFLFDKKNPTKYDFIIPYISNEQANREMISDLKLKNVKMVLGDHSIETDNYSLSRYIAKNYKLSIVSGWEVWVKN